MGGVWGLSEFAVGPGDRKDADDNAVDGERSESMPADPGHEPGNDDPGNEEAYDKTHGQYGPLMRADRGFCLEDELQQFETGGCDHHRDRQEEAEF